MAGRKGHRNDPNERKRKADRNELPRGKTVWKKSDMPKPAFSGNKPNSNLKFTCQCGFSSKTGPEHKCPDKVWPITANWNKRA